MKILQIRTEMPIRYNYIKKNRKNKMKKSGKRRIVIVK